ncbi:unnamed protein product, partial [Lampetra planeri]
RGVSATPLAQGGDDVFASDPVLQKPPRSKKFHTICKQQPAEDPNTRNIGVKRDLTCDTCSLPLWSESALKTWITAEPNK